LSVAELWWRPISPISSFGILWKVKSYFHTFRAKSFFFIENGNLQQPLYSTHGTSRVLDSSLWLAVSIDAFFTEKVKEMLVSNPKNTLGPNSQKLHSTSYNQFFKWWIPGKLYWAPAPQGTGSIPIGCIFRKFYLLKTSFTLEELVSLVKVFRLLRLERIVLVFIVWTQ
jgi:hypothetical protein